MAAAAADIRATPAEPAAENGDVAAEINALRARERAGRANVNVIRSRLLNPCLGVS